MEKNRSIISTTELEAMLHSEGLVIVDCRHQLKDVDWGRRSYERSHIPGAYYAHLDEDLSGAIIPGETGRHPLPSDWKPFQDLIGSFGINPQSHVVVYDQSHGGIASRLWWMLRLFGHDHVSVLDGGWQMWHEEMRSTTNASPRKESVTFNASPNLDLFVDMSEVQECTKNPNSLIIDARAAHRYRGEDEPIDSVAGHIPSAISLPFLDNLNDDHTWKSPGELKERFASIFERNNEEVIVYCGSGVTACHDILAMTIAGYDMPKLYPGAWSEWITNPDNEIETS